MIEMEKVIIKRGRFKGETFEIEGTIKEVMGTDCLPELAMFKGNMAALNALNIDNYNITDAPFYYGKIGIMGYIISKKDFEETGVEE